MSNHNPPTNGFDKRKNQINRKGRPKDFDGLRELAKQIAHEKVLSGGQPLVIEGHAVTVAEVILRQWAKSQNPQLQRAFIETAFGKVPDKLDVTSGGEALKITVEYVGNDGTDKAE
jgi:hypothetical protein